MAPYKGRTCAVCGATFDATYGAQRTCGRVCGGVLNARESGRHRQAWPSSRVAIRNCVHCNVLFAARGGRTICSEDCARERTTQQTSASIMRRYRTDPEFRDRVNARAQARRADKLGLGSTRITLSYLMQRDKGRCGICRKPVRAKRGPMRPSVDHIVPLTNKGRHELANVQLAHYRCNLSKNNRGGGEQLLLVG